MNEMNDSFSAHNPKMVNEKANDVKRDEAPGVTKYSFTLISFKPQTFESTVLQNTAPLGNASASRYCFQAH